MHFVPRRVLAPHLRLNRPPHLVLLYLLIAAHDVRAGDVPFVLFLQI